jgi:hypothetical protein
MKGKDLLARLLGSTAAPAAAVAVAAGAPGLSAEQQTAGNDQLEGLVENAYAEGRTAGAAEGRTAERERFGAVLTSEEAASRMGLAITLLSTTDNTPEQIIGALKADRPAAATAAAPAPAAGTPPPSQAAVKDPIAEQTGLVDTGATKPPVDGVDEKQVAALWGGAISAVSGKGVVAGSVWDGLVPSAAN